MITYMPYSVLAQTTDVGVNIVGDISIEVVTTISADITLDLTTGERTPAYMTMENKSFVPVSAKITDISTTSEGAPSTFVGANDKDWDSLSKSETSTYVNFNILGSGQNVVAQDILADTEVDLGVLNSGLNIGGFACGENTPCYIPTDSNEKIFKIDARFGGNWAAGDKNFTYQITTVYAQADSYEQEEKTFTNDNIYGIGIDVVNSIDDGEVVLNDPTKDYLNLKVTVKGADKEINEFVNSSTISVMVNYKLSTYTDKLVFFGADTEIASYAMPYSIDALNDDENPHYLTIVVTIDDQAYTYIARVYV